MIQQLLLGTGLGLLAMGILIFLNRQPALSNTANAGPHSNYNAYRSSRQSSPPPQRNSTRSNRIFHTQPGSSCSICWDVLDEATMINLRCGHALHAACLVELRSHGHTECPECRTKL